ncbi:MAG: ExbD/TolR family protein, partial [Sphingobacteriia bacterium]
MNFRASRRRPTSEVSTGALTDIMFFLLLFFLIASTITNPSVIKLMLPQAESSNVISKRMVNVAVTRDLRYYVDSKEVPLADLQDEIAAATANLKEPTVNLQIDRDVPVQNMVEIMDVVKKLKLKLVLA